MDYEKMRKNNILLPDLVIDNSARIPMCGNESIELKLWPSNLAAKANKRQSKNISPSYLPASSPNHGSQPMSLPSSLPEPDSTEAMQHSGIALVSQTIGTCQNLRRPSQYTGEIGELRSICEIPSKYRSIFSDYPSFNVIQSKALDILLYTDQPLVISAPTGSGKTVIFELAIVNLLVKLNEMNYRGDFKIVYMAPVKALCTERYHDWQEKFLHLGLKCHEVTGDSYDSTVTDLKNYNLVLTTPEKWDSLTRKWKQNKQLVQLVKLFLIDEVHLLSEDKRGPVLEAVVSRMKTIQKTLSYSKHSSGKNCEIQIPIRFIAVSATIPNIEDLADWLGDGFRPAEFIKIGEEYRPVKLNKVVLGFPTSLKQNPFMFDLNLNYKLRDLLFKYAEGKPTLIFCSTRKGVTQTAQTLAKEITFHFSVTQRESLILSANNLVDNKLRDTVLCGVGSHHAGMDLNDRHTTEDLFRRLLLPILVTTSTLAMGVNLPAHLVIVKSTQQYIGGIYQDYSETQMLQMIGRAGRPQFDTTATAIIMTRQQDKERYERLIGGRDLVESTLHRHLAEHLNAEVVLETITDVCIAMNWLRSTFLYVRALKNPAHYGFAKGLSEMEITKKLQDLCLYEMNGLASANLVTVMNGLDIRPTDNGRLMASFYLSLETMKIFNKITGMESLNDMIKVVASCHEFSELQLRRVEKRVLNELNKIKDRECIRFPIKGVIKDMPMKVNVLTQATFGCLPINDHSLHQDSLKIVRVGERISRCLRKYVLNTGHYNSLLNSALLAKCYYSKLWEDSIYVTKQLSGIGAAYSNLLASAGKTTFQSLLIANPRDLERILNKAPPLGNDLKKAVVHLPKYSIEINLNAMQNEGTLTLRLENIEDISEFATAGLDHWLTIIVGDNTNKVLHIERLNDNQLLQMEGVVSWCFSIDSSNVNEIYGHVISDQWVGIDVNITAAVKQKGRRSVNMMMKNAIEQYASKMGIPNPLIDKKEAAKPKKPTKLTIVEQIRLKGRQLPELGVKIGNLEINIPTPLKQSNLDRFLYTPAKRLKLPATYAEFIKENASVARAINKDEFIENLLPSINSDRQCQIDSNSVDINDSISKDCQQFIHGDEWHGEYDGTGGRNQNSQETCFQDIIPYHEEKHKKHSVSHNQNYNNTQEKSLMDMEPTTQNNPKNWEMQTDQNHHLPLHNYSIVDSVIERPRICDKKNDYAGTISSDNEDEVNWVTTYKLEEQDELSSDSRKSSMRGITDFTRGRKELGSQPFLILEKIQDIRQREPRKCLDKYGGSEFRDSGCNKLEIQTRNLPSYIESDTACNKNRVEAQMTSYSETQSEYLQRMKGHFEDFKVFDENCVNNANNERILSFARSRLGSLTKNARQPVCNDESCGEHDDMAERKQSSQADQMQDTQSFDDERYTSFSAPLKQIDFNMHVDAIDSIYNNHRPDQIYQNTLFQSDNQNITYGDEDKNNFDYEKEFSNQNDDMPVQGTQIPKERIFKANLELLKGSCNEPLTGLSHQQNNDVSDYKSEYECFKKQSQEGSRNSGEEPFLELNSYRTNQPVQDGHQHPDGCMLETCKAVNEYTIDNRGFILASTPDQTKENILVRKSPQKNETGEVEVSLSEMGILPYECCGDNKSSNIRLQDHSCSKINILSNNDLEPPESKSIRENEPANNIFCKIQNTNSVENQRVDQDFKEKSKVPMEAELDVLEENVEILDKSESCYGKLGFSTKLGTEVFKREEVSLKNESLDRDQPREKPNIPKHHFPIFMNYDSNMDKKSPQEKYNTIKYNKQEKLNFKFSGKNCTSPQVANDKDIPKMIFDWSINNFESRETNVINADNTDSITNSAKTPKLAFDLDIDSLLDSIDSTETSTCGSHQKHSPNRKEIKISGKNITKHTEKSIKKDWDANDPLMVLFYGPREKKKNKLTQSFHRKVSPKNVTKSTVLADNLFIKPTTNVQTKEHILSEKKNLKPNNLVNNIVSSRMDNNVKSAPLKRLFPYCKGYEEYHPKVESKLSSTKVNPNSIAKSSKIPSAIVVCQETKKLENTSICNKPMMTQKHNSNLKENFTQEILNSKNANYCVQQREWPRQNAPEMCQQITQPLPNVLNFNHPTVSQNIKSCCNEGFKSAATTDSNHEVMQAQSTKWNALDAHKSDHLHEVLRSAVQTNPKSIYQPAVGRKQNVHKKSLELLPLTIVETTTDQSQAFRQGEHTFESNKIECMLSHRKVSAHEEVVRIRHANSDLKEDVDLSKPTQQSQCLIKKSFHEADQISHRTLLEQQEHLNTSINETYSIQGGSYKLSVLARSTQAQFKSFPRQYSRQNNCDFEEISGGKYSQGFDNLRVEPIQQTKSSNSYLNCPSPESMPDIVCSSSSKYSVDHETDNDDNEESKFRWLASQNTFTQRSEVNEDIFSSNDSETRYESKLHDGDNAAVDANLKNSEQCSSDDDDTFNRDDDLEEQNDSSQSDIPFVSRKFEYNHTQTPRCISKINIRSSKRASIQREDVHNDTSTRYTKYKPYENLVAGKKVSYEIDAEHLGERKYQSVFEQMQNNTFQISPPKEQQCKRSASHLETPNDADRDFFNNRMTQSYSISGQPRQEVTSMQTEKNDKWSGDDQFHQLYEREDFDKFRKYGGECLPQKRETENARNYRQGSASFCASRSDEIVNSPHLQYEQPRMGNFSSETLPKSRFYHNLAENDSSNTPKAIQPQKMFQYCQKRPPGAIDTEFNLLKTKHRRNF